MRTLMTSLALAILAGGVASGQQQKDLEILALVDHYDFYNVREPKDRSKFMFDTETAEGCEDILKHVLLTGATSVLWRPCSGSVMRYHSDEERFPLVVTPTDKRRVHQNESAVNGFISYNTAKIDIIREMMASIAASGRVPGVHWPFEETHHMGWTFGAWNLEHPEYWGVTKTGQVWSGRTSLAYPAVSDHKMRILEELLERGARHIFIDAWRSGSWSPRFEYVKPELERWKARYGTEPPSDSRDPVWCKFVSETQHAWFKRVKKRLESEKIPLTLGVQLVGDPDDPRDQTLISRGIDWRVLVDEGVLDGLVVMGIAWDVKDPFGSTEKIYRDIVARCKGKCKVYFPIQAYDFTRKSFHSYAKATELTIAEVTAKLLELTRDSGADGVVLEVVDYNNYPRAVRRELRKVSPYKSIED